MKCANPECDNEVNNPYNRFNKKYCCHLCSYGYNMKKAAMRAKEKRRLANESS